VSLIRRFNKRRRKAAVLSSGEETCELAPRNREDGENKIIFSWREK
jgi:hypothetical protein